MKEHTARFKQNLAKMGREIDSIVSYYRGGSPAVVVLLHDELYSISVSYEGALLKSVMKQLNIESSVSIPIGTTVKYQLGVKVGNNYEYLDYGDFIVKEIEKNEDTGRYLITCYDYMLKTMKEYEGVPDEYFPMSVRDFLIYILDTQLSMQYYLTNFYNYDKIMTKDYYKGLGYTYRDVLDEIAQVAGGFIVINNQRVTIRYPRTTNDTIDENYLKDVNVQFGQKYGPINSIVLSRSAESDNVYIRDDESIAQNGLCELKIVDNQIMNWNNRSEFLQGLLNALDGVEYYINDYTSPGILYYDFGDYYNISIGNNTYKCLMLNDEINVTSGLEEIIHTDMPEESVTDYTKANKTDRSIKQAYIIVDKQQGEIDANAQRISLVAEEVQDITNANLVVNSNFGAGNYNGWQGIGNPVIVVQTDGGKKWLNLSRSTASGYGGIFEEIKNVQASTKYTFSFLAKSSISSKANIGVRYLNGATIISTDWYSWGLTSAAKKYSRTYTTPANTTGVYLLFYGLDNTIFNYSFTEVKFEPGELATEWCANVADHIKTSINLSPESIQIGADNISLAGKNIALTSDNISISSTNFSVTNAGVITANSGKIGGIDINSNGVYSFGTSNYDGFGLWKKGFHSYDDSSIIIHAGGNTNHVGDAKFRILANGKVITNNSIFCFPTEDNEQVIRVCTLSDKNAGYEYQRSSYLFPRGAMAIYGDHVAGFSVDSNTSVVQGEQHNIGYRNTITYDNYYNMVLRTREDVIVQDYSRNYKAVYASAFVQSSSKRYKENIEDLKNDIIMKLRPVKFDYKKDSKMRGENVAGLIAEDVEKIDKNLVSYKNVDGKEVAEGIDYSKIVPYLILKVQKQQNEIDELKTQIKEIKEMIKK